MSLQIMNTTIQTNNYLEFEEVVNSLEEKLTLFSENHKDFSAVILKDPDSLEIIVKTLTLKEHAN
jgi:hypothetical protein